MLFLVFLFVTGINQAFAFLEGFITNIIDATHCSRMKAAIGVSMLGVLLSAAFTSNIGWSLFDMTEHFILRYIVITVGFLQCLSVGWFFEYETTAAASENHAKSLRALSLYFWIPTVFISFYANFGFPEYRFFGLLIIAFFTIIALCVSKKRSSMPYNSWYHEIVLCGVDKLSMSITSLTHIDHRRSFWMLPFETYLGICIKFINPACLMFIFFNNLQEDLTRPYNN